MSRLTLNFGCAALIAGLVLTSSLSAQQRGGGFGGRGMMGSPLMLVASESVQKEIGITDDQKAKLTSLREEFQKDMEKVRTDAGIESGGGFANLTDDQRTKLQEGMKPLTEKYTGKLKETLKPEQVERLQQIGYQAAGPGAFSNPELVKALDLSQEQQDKIASVNKDFQAKMQALGRDAGREAFTKLRSEQSADLAKVLTKEQSEKFAKLKGKDFDLSTINAGGFGGGKGRPGGKRGEKKE